MRVIGSGVRAAMAAAVLAGGVVALGVGATGAAGAGSAFVRGGGVEADVRWTGDRAEPRAMVLRVRAGDRAARIGGLQRRGFGIPPAGPFLRLANLDRARGFEVVLQTTTGGIRCCLRTHIVRVEPDGSLALTVRRWGQAGYRLADLNRDRAAEFLGGDERVLAGLRVPPPAAVYPIRIWALRDGRLRDVTRAFPRHVRADMRSHWRTLGALVRAGATPRAGIASYLATAMLLGVEDAALARLRSRLGDPADRADIDRIDTRLRALGYAASPGPEGA